jgi:O-Antigen ligase
MTQLAIDLIALAFAPFAIYFTLKRPLIFPFGLYILFVPFDGILNATTGITRLMAIVTGAALFFHMILTRRVLAPPKSWFAWAVYVLLASLTALWTIDPAATSLCLTQLVQLFVFFTILAMFPADREDVRAVGAIVVLSGVLAAAWGLVNYSQGLRTQEDRLTIAVNGLLIDPNHIAAALMLPIALAVGTLIGTRDMRLRIGSLIALAILVAATLFTGSRGGLIAVVVMLLYIAWKTRYRFQILALMSAGGLASLLQPTVWDRFAEKGLAGGSGRLVIWDTARLALKDHWLLGAGIGAFPAAYNHVLFAMYQPIFQGWSRPAHNAFLSAAVEVGIVGAVVHLYCWWQSWSDSRGNVVIEAAIIALATASLFLDVLEFKYLWLAFSMAVLVKNVAEPKYLRGQPRPPKRVAGTIAARRLPWRDRSRLASAADREAAVGNL